MNQIRKICSFTYFTVLIIICSAIVIFRAIDIWTDFAFSGKYFKPIANFLFSNFPMVSTILAVLLVLSFIALFLARMDIEREDKEKGSQIDDDGKSTKGFNQ